MNMIYFYQDLLCRGKAALLLLLCTLPSISGCGRRHVPTLPFGIGLHLSDLIKNQDRVSQPLIACQVYTLDKDVDVEQSCPQQYICSEEANQLTYGYKTLFVHHCQPEVPHKTIQDRLTCQIKKGSIIIASSNCQRGSMCDDSNPFHLKMASGHQLSVSFCVSSSEDMLHDLLINKSCSIGSPQNFIYEERGCSQQQKCTIGPLMYTTDDTELTSYFCEDVLADYVNWLSLFTNAVGKVVLSQQTSSVKIAEAFLPLKTDVETMYVSTTEDDGIYDDTGGSSGSGYADQHTETAKDLFSGSIFKRKESFSFGNENAEQEESLSKNHRLLSQSGTLADEGNKQDLDLPLGPKHRGYFDFLDIDDPDIKQRISDLTDELKLKDQRRLVPLKPDSPTINSTTSSVAT